MSNKPQDADSKQPDSSFIQARRCKAKGRRSGGVRPAAQGACWRPDGRLHCADCRLAGLCSPFRQRCLVHRLDCRDRDGGECRCQRCVGFRLDYRFGQGCAQGLQFFGQCEGWVEGLKKGFEGEEVRRQGGKKSSNASADRDPNPPVDRVLLTALLRAVARCLAVGLHPTVAAPLRAIRMARSSLVMSR